MNFLKVSFALSLIVCFVTSNAQAPPPVTNSNISQLPAIKSPQANELGRFGNVPVSKYTGAPSITIPLAEVTNGPIKVPVYLQYNAIGCRPEEHPTWVGLNWSLSAGGLITRNTNGKNDEYQTPSANPNTSYLEKYWANGASDWNQNSYMQYVTASEDRAPDEFAFSFNGISGSFYLNYDGKWAVKSKEGVTLTVAYVKSSLNYYDSNNNYFSTTGITQFTLKTDDGTTYIFGRDVNAIEFSLPALYDGVADAEALLFHYGPAEACAWQLSEIIAPTGQHVNFTYATAYSFKQVTYSQVLFPDSEGHNRYLNYQTKFLTTTPYLTKIEADNGMSCAFAKSPSNELKYTFFNEPDLAFANYADFNRYGIPRANMGQYYKLDNIVLSSKNGLIKAIVLKYIENSNERLKLKTVQTTSWSTSDAPTEQYSFEYNPSLLPPYNTAKEDHWGFYNGKNYFTTENGQFFVENYLPDYIASRTPNATLMQSEILTKITYPTKGYTKFYFEPHDYSSVVLRAPTYQLSTNTNNAMAGGLRIKKLEDYDGISPTPVVKEYFYTKNYIGGGTLSSGILASNPTYWEKALNTGYALFSSKPLGYKNLTNGNHITYSEVTEKSSNGYIVSTYTNQDNGYLDKPPFNTLFNESQEFPYEKMLFNSLELERGLELSMKYYASDKFLLREISNEYNNDPARYNKYVRSVQIQNYLSTYNQGISAYGIYTFYPHLKSQTEKEYFRAGGDITSKEDYTYDPTYNHLKSVTNTTSEGTKMITKYTYPYNYSNGDPASTATINVMVSRNILNTPIEISTFVEKNGVQSLVESKLNIYNTFNGLPLLYQQYSINPKEPLTDFQPASASAGSSIIKDSRYVLKTTLENYDNKGNLLQYRDNSGTTSYIWGYDQSFPIAEVKNATAAQIAYNGLEMGGSPGQSGWENFGPATTIADFDVQDKSASFAGLYAVKIAPPSSGGINYATTINVTPGAYSKEKYKMSCWIKTPVGYTSNKAFICMYTIKANTCCAVYPVNAPVSQTFIPATNGKWQYFETYLDLGAISALLAPGNAGDVLSIRAYSANTDNSLPVYIDEVRVHPVDALMKTYTYNFNPQVGLSTILDENNQIINKYEYNIFNKLKVVRDKDNNIVKKINYKYKGNYLIKCEGLQGKSLASYDFIAPNDAIRECTPGGTVSYSVSGDFNVKIDGVIRTLPYASPDGTSWTKTFDRDYFLVISTTNGSHSFTIIFNN